MKNFSRPICTVFIAAAAFVFTTPARAADAPLSPAIPANRSDVSFQHELQRAIDRGLEWLQKNQNSAGYWSTADYPAVTALALTAWCGNPARANGAAQPEWVANGYAFLLKNAQPDGGIYAKGLLNYNTSLAMMALVSANRAEYEPVLRRARAFTVKMQGDFDAKTAAENPFAGGVGYGDKNKNSDLSNTLVALEALYHTRHLVKDTAAADAKDLNWSAAIHFLQQCQNLPGYNKQPWASDDPQNKGGFVYDPASSKAPDVKLPSGKVALRSYGSMSYAGLLSYIYADVKQTDPRVKAVLEWLRGNFSLEENPGMGAQGLYYYYELMTKALTAANVDKLELADGRKIDWRRDVAMKLLNLQQKDGSWLNDNARWWEKDPALVTAYAVITLSMIHRGI
jgi:squalene-hopene/tetraprenyl-beta-curcumene cyclase